MLRFLGFGRKEPPKQAESAVVSADSSSEKDVIEDDIFEQNKVAESTTETDYEESFDETEDSSEVETSLAAPGNDDPVALEGKQSITDATSGTAVSENAEDSEVLPPPAAAAATTNKTSSENVPTEYLVSVMESIGQEAVKGDLSSEAEVASNVFSQLSVDLFENTLRDDPDFPLDLDRIYTWFTDVLTDAERMTCAHVLLSTLKTNQLKFLFSSLSVDPDARAEVAYLDLAESQASLKHNQGRVVESPAAALVDLSRFSSLEFKPEDDLFGGVDIFSIGSSRSSSRFSNLTEKSSKSQSLSNPTKPPGFDKKVDHLDGLFNRFDGPPESKCPAQLSPTLSVSPSLSPCQSQSQYHSQSQSQYHSLSQSQSQVSLTLSASSSKLSIEAPEYKPLPNYPEMAYANLFYNDFLSWLKTLRLHKYGPTLLPHYERSKAALLRSSEEDLEAYGVAALGARKKFKRLFEQILAEKPPE